MYRRDFLKFGSMALVSAAIPKNSWSYNPLKYALTSVPDEGTTLDELNALKARKVAEYVITKNNHPGLLSHNPNLDPPQEGYQKVEAVMAIDGKRYTVSVINANENGEAMPRDSIYISVRPQGTTRQDQLTSFSDEGLDGKCNYGFIPANISGTGKEVYFNSGVYGLKPKGLEHKDRFQVLYDQTLNTLIEKFYEKKK